MFQVGKFSHYPQGRCRLCRAVPLSRIYNVCVWLKLFTSYIYIYIYIYIYRERERERERDRVEERETERRRESERESERESKRERGCGNVM